MTVRRALLQMMPVLGRSLKHAQGATLIGE